MPDHVEFMDIKLTEEEVGICTRALMDYYCDDEFDRCTYDRVKLRFVRLWRELSRKEKQKRIEALEKQIAEAGDLKRNLKAQLEEVRKFKLAGDM